MCSLARRARKKRRVEEVSEEDEDEDDEDDETQPLRPMAAYLKTAPPQVNPQSRAAAISADMSAVMAQAQALLQDESDDDDGDGAQSPPRRSVRQAAIEKTKPLAPRADADQTDADADGTPEFDAGGDPEPDDWKQPVVDEPNADELQDDDDFPTPVRKRRIGIKRKRL